MRPSVTVPEYLAQRSDIVVIYSDDESVGAGLIPLYNQSNIEVLYMTDAVDKILREHWSVAGRLVEFRRLDVDPPKGSKSKGLEHRHNIDQATIDALRLLFQSEVSPRLKAELRSLSPNGPAAILSMEEADRKRMEFVEVVHHYQKEGRLNELPSEVQTMARDGFPEMMNILSNQTIILNDDNEIVCELLTQLRPDSSSASGQIQTRSFWKAFRHAKSNPSLTRSRLDFAPDIARFLHGQALLSSGLHLSSEKLTEISQSQTALICGLLRALKSPP
jgi:hypothetical protein